MGDGPRRLRLDRLETLTLADRRLLAAKGGTMLGRKAARRRAEQAKGKIHPPG
jgi:hypothetical protein